MGPVTSVDGFDCSSVFSLSACTEYMASPYCSVQSAAEEDGRSAGGELLDDRHYPYSPLGVTSLDRVRQPNSRAEK